MKFRSKIKIMIVLMPSRDVLSKTATKTKGELKIKSPTGSY